MKSNAASNRMGYGSGHGAMGLAMVFACRTKDHKTNLCRAQRDGWHGRNSTAERAWREGVSRASTGRPTTGSLHSRPGGGGVHAVRCG
jgi:hypothetical protein